jgi:hypothetical protein
MGLNIEYLAGQTPLTEDEKDGLKPSITTREELDILVQKNIEANALRKTYIDALRLADKGNCEDLISYALS